MFIFGGSIPTAARTITGLVSYPAFLRHKLFWIFFIKKEVSTAFETRAEEMATANKDRGLTALFAK